MEKRYDYKLAEPEIQTYWQKHQIYEFNQARGPIYSIDTPPPTVSGSLHIGHIFSYTHTDIIARFKRMNGFAVFYPFGFDDNGLPTERYIEKKLDVRPHTMPRTEFINLCLKETVEVEEQFKQLWQRMGLSVDWDYAYATIAPEARKISQESFILLYNKNFIYRQYEPALYCTTCRTSVAQAELDDIEKTSLFSQISFKTPEGEELIIATTRPELLPSCVALFYHPNDTRYTHLKGNYAAVPLFNINVPILADEMVDPEKGTGLVMCCTFGDKTDIHWFKTHKLPYRQSLDHGGKFNTDIPFIGGMKVEEARKTVLEELKKVGVLGAQKETTRAVNVHERCKKEIEYIALSQWFLKILDYKKELLEQAEKINWHPAHMKQRYINWVENIGWDWCLSRQRFYGIPFPVWYCANRHILVAPLNALPIDPQESPYPGSKCDTCGNAEITPETDVMDTWNTSSLTPQICYSLFDGGKHSPFDATAVKKFFPMSMRPQAHDIIRTWAFYTMIKAWMHYDEIPWSDIVISGHVLSDSKEKLSKSKDNSKMAPEELLRQYPADVIRYWTASGRLGHDVAFSENQLKIGQRLVTKIWNAFIFVHEHIKDIKHEKPATLGAVNEWILHASSLCFAEYQKQLNQYEFSLALDAIEQFFWHAFCDNYLELIKDQLFKPEQYDPALVAATKWTLYTVGLRILQLYAPYLPHVTDAIYIANYKNHIKQDSIHITTFNNTMYTFEQSNKAVSYLLDVVTQVRRLKTDHQLSLKVPLKELKIYAGQSTQPLDLLVDLATIIKGVTQAENIIMHVGTQPTALKQENDQWFATVLINDSGKS